MWTSLLALYGPWLFPLSPDQTARSGAGSWVQQLTGADSALLPPWIPGDREAAATILSSLISCLAALQQHASAPATLSLVWQLYASQWAQVGVKEHVLGVVHPALLTLDWAQFRPSSRDVELMVRLVGSYLPACHAFLGSLVCSVDWAGLVEGSSAAGPALLPALLCLLVKLGGEPAVRQGGRLLPALDTALSWPWQSLQPPQYEPIAQWAVMSLDCKCVVRHPDRSPMDEAVLRLLRTAAGFPPDQEEEGILDTSESTVAKQKIWVKCCTRLLVSVGSKQKNFLSHHQPALHTAIRKILEDLALVSGAGGAASQTVVKDFLSLLNSNQQSVLPGSSLMVLQSWLTTQPHTAPVLHALLNQAAITVHDSKLGAGVLEAVLESCFTEVGGCDGQVGGRWGGVLPHLSWPAGPRLQQLLDQALQAGHLLTLHSFLCHKRPGLQSSREEQQVGSSLLEWVRCLAQPVLPGTNTEPKLALFYRQLVTLIQRQAEHGDLGWAVRTIAQFSDLLAQLADCSPGWSQNLLGAIGLRSSAGLSHKAKFLARALHVYLKMLLNENKSGLVEKELDDEASERRKKCISSGEVKPHMDKLAAFKSNKAFSGIHDLVDWVLVQIKDDSNCLADAHLFIDHIVIDKLYTELYLQ